MIIPILSDETKEMFSLILGDIEKIRAEMGGKLPPSHNITILMTEPLHRRLCYEHFGRVEPTERDGMRLNLFGYPIRVVYGDEEEWFISVAHSLNVKRQACEPQKGPYFARFLPGV